MNKEKSPSLYHQPHSCPFQHSIPQTPQTTPTYTPAALLIKNSFNGATLSTTPNPTDLTATTGAKSVAYSLFNLSTTPRRTWFAIYLSETYPSSDSTEPMSCPWERECSRCFVRDWVSRRPWFRPWPARGWIVWAASLRGG